MKIVREMVFIKWIKKALAWMCVFFLCSQSLLNVRAESKIRVFCDGAEIVFDQPPVIEKGRTLVPFRDVFEALRFSVKFDEKNKNVTATNGEAVVIITTNKTTALVNGTEKKMDVSAKIMNGRIFVPLRFVSENCGFSVKWDEKNRIINIDSSMDNNDTPYYSDTKVPDFGKLYGIERKTSYSRYSDDFDATYTLKISGYCYDETVVEKSSITEYTKKLEENGFNKYDVKEKESYDTYTYYKKDNLLVLFGYAGGYYVVAFGNLILN